MPTNLPGSGTEASAPCKIAVYTCITQGYDTMKIPLSVDNRLAYFCFTDSPESVLPPWEFRPIGLKDLSPKDQNRYIKMHPHEFLPDYDVTVYVDGNIQIIGDLSALVDSLQHEPEDIFMFKHPWRNCIYPEAASCAHLSFDWIWKIASQMRRYSKSGYPVENGLFEASVIIRKDSNRLHRLMNAWWSEYSSGVKRDQLSLTYVAWLLGIPLGSLGDNDPRINHRYFRFNERPRKRKLKLIIRKHINRTIASLIPYGKLFGITMPANRNQP
jgi:hypothetical protein